MTRTAPSFRFYHRAARAVLLVLVAFALLLPSSAHAKRRRKKEEQQTQGSAFHMIKAVNESAKTVSVGTENNKDQTLKVLKVTTFTEITVDGQKATLHDLQPGMKVDLDMESDNEAKTLDATHVNKP